MKFLQELKAIQLILHLDTQLQLEPIIQNITEYLSISSTSVIQKDSFLIFALHFSIITISVYDMYQPIFLPFFVESNIAIFIGTEIDYLSFSDDSKFYFIMTQQQSEACNKSKSYTIFRGKETIQGRT